MNEFLSVVIHVGFHKTGSTYLQELFDLLPIGFYRGSGEEIRLLEKPEIAPGLSIESLKDEIENRSRNIKCPKIIVSHEGLSGHPHGYPAPNPFYIADSLHNILPSAKILFTVRNQFDYLLSLYAFRVALKGQEKRDLVDFLSQEGKKGLFQKLEYHHLIECYQRLFTKEKVLVLPLELLIENPDSFFQKLFSFLDYDGNIKPPTKKINPSTRLVPVIRFWRRINAIFASFLYVLRLLEISPRNDKRIRFAYYNLIKRKITPFLNRVLKRSRKLSIPKDIYADLHPRFARSNEKLSKMTGLDLSSYGYPCLKKRS